MILCGTLPCIDACPDRQECMLAMAKAPTPSRNKIPIPGYDMKDGKIVGKPSHAKLSRPAQYQKANKKRYVRRTAGSQRP